MKKIETVISTINDENFSILSKMNIKENATVINQSKKYKYTEVNDSVRYYDMYEVGVGLSRSFGLYRAASEIVVFADDDLVFCDSYERIIAETYERYSKADAIIFDLNFKSGKYHNIRKKHRVRWYSFMRYGTASLTVKRNKIIQNRITFSSEFGGGTLNGSGEDTLFLKDCLKAKMHIIAVPITYATLTETRDSTWFSGYNDNYFINKGKLFYELSKNFYILLILKFALKKLGDYKYFQKVKLLLTGAKTRKKIKK